MLFHNSIFIAIFIKRFERFEYTVQKYVCQVKSLKTLVFVDKRFIHYYISEKRR